MKPIRDLDGHLVMPKICALCGRRRGEHKAGTFNCPTNKRRDKFPSFDKDQVYKEQSK